MFFSPLSLSESVSLLSRICRDRYALCVVALISASCSVDVQSHLYITFSIMIMSCIALPAAGVLASAHAYGAAVPLGALGVFLGVQTSRVRFRFERDALEVVIGEEETESGENAFVGGRNRWAYDSFINWEFFPSPAFPVLVYFKEKQTKEEGQIHFFPVLFNATELYDVMAARCGPTKNSARV